MNVLLLSGGSGKRLWPLSNDVRSKQFLKIFKRTDGVRESMVQRMCRMIYETDTNAEITIATSQSQVASIRNQLGDSICVCVEPCRRDTFPAIALSTAFLHDEKNLKRSDVLVVCPVDPYVDNDYFEMIQNLSTHVLKSDANLVLMGVEPTYPSTKYGYIIPYCSMPVSKVKFFKEKPNETNALKYINDGALWNSGVFAFKIGYVLDLSTSPKILLLVFFLLFLQRHNQKKSFPNSHNYYIIQSNLMCQILTVQYLKHIQF